MVSRWTLIWKIMSLRFHCWIKTWSILLPTFNCSRQRWPKSTLQSLSFKKQIRRYCWVSGNSNASLVVKVTNWTKWSAMTVRCTDPPKQTISSRRVSLVSRPPTTQSGRATQSRRTIRSTAVDPTTTCSYLSTLSYQDPNLLGTSVPEYQLTTKCVNASFHSDSWCSKTRKSFTRPDSSRWATLLMLRWMTAGWDLKLLKSSLINKGSLSFNTRLMREFDLIQRLDINLKGVLGFWVPTCMLTLRPFSRRMLAGG